MRVLKNVAALSVLYVLAVPGCGPKANVTSGQYYAQNEQLERPEHILVYDFAASTADLPDSIPLNPGYDPPSTTPTAEELAAGRELGAEVAKQLVADIQSMGFDAERADDTTPRHLGDLILAGYFTSVDPGSRTKRMALGFGSGTAELKTEAAGFLVTESGLRMLGSRTVDSGGGGKGPGLLVPIAVTAATANPIGIVVGGAMKVTGEATGRSTIKGAAKRTADELAEQVREAFHRQGWI